MAFKKPTPQVDIFDGMFASVPANETLRSLNRLVNWEALRLVLATSYDSSGVGTPGFDPVILAKLLLLESIYNLSDIRVCEEAKDRLSFREFLGLSASDTVPDDTTLVRFRNRLAKHKLDSSIDLFFQSELKRHGLRVRAGSIAIIDASIIESSTKPPAKNPGNKHDNTDANTHNDKVLSDPSPKIEQRDSEATSTQKNGHWHHGHKLHIAQNATTGIVDEYQVTTAKVHDSQVFEELLEGTEGLVLADRGYDSAAHRRWLRERKIEDGIMRKASRNESSEGRLWKKEWNKILSGTRGRIEKTFAILKRWRGCARARYLGVEKVKRQFGWAIAAHNLLTMNRLLGTHA